MAKFSVNRMAITNKEQLVGEWAVSLGCLLNAQTVFFLEKAVVVRWNTET